MARRCAWRPGELVRIGLGAGVDGPVAWLRLLPGPVRACYEARRTGFGLDRAAIAAGIGMRVLAPGMTPRASADRVKTDRKDAELVARPLLARQLKPITVPTPQSRPRARRCAPTTRSGADPITARHRVSTMLLSHGRVYPEATPWDAGAPDVAGAPGLRSAGQRPRVRRPAGRR
jgi:transposase